MTSWHRPARSANQAPIRLRRTRTLAALPKHVLAVTSSRIHFHTDRRVRARLLAPARTARSKQCLLSARHPQPTNIAIGAEMGFIHKEDLSPAPLGLCHQGPILGCEGGALP